MRRIAKRLEIDVAEDRWPELVAAASFSSMKARADALVPNAGQIWIDQPAFFHRVTSGQWRELRRRGRGRALPAARGGAARRPELRSRLHRP